MQVVKNLFLAAAAASMTFANAEHMRSTDMTTAEFMGNSGKMVLWPNSAPGNWIAVRQLKFEEVTALGEKVNGPKKQMNVAGQNVWKDFKEERTLGRSVDTTEFEVLDGGRTSFNLYAHYAELTSTFEESTVCGQFLNETCSKSVTVEKDEIKFSFVIAGWEFDNAENKLQYGLAIKSNSTWNNETAHNETALSDEVDGKKTLTTDAGELVIPTTATIRGGDSDVEVPVEVTMYPEGDEHIIMFTFPSFSSEGQSLYYDPDLSVYQPGSDDFTSDDSTSGATTDDSTSGATTLATSVAGIALFSVANMIMA